MKATKVSKLREKRKQQLQIQQIFIELVLYMIFLAVLYLVSFSNRDPAWFNAVNHINQHLVTANNVSAGGTTLRFKEVISTAQFYIWLEKTVIPLMFPRYSESGSQLNAYQRLYLQDETNFRVGPMRLRQVRAVEEPCHKQLWDNSSCFDEYSIFREDDQSYCVAWEPKPCERGQEVYNITYESWKFVSSVDIWGLPTEGLHATYGGGGYIAEFLVNYNISQTILNDLYKYVWIDRKTRAVFTEFTLYNVDNNVFVYASFLCEFPEIGGVLTSVYIKPFRPYQHVGDLGVFVLVCELIVLVGIVIFSVRKFLFVYRHGKKVLKELWNFLDLLIIILFYICTIMYIGRWIMINYAMEQFEKNKNKFVNFNHISWWDELFNIFLAFVIFLTTIRIMRVLSYNERINQLGKVLKHVSRDLMGCFVMFLLVYTAFVTFGHLIFGRQLETYKNLFVSSTTLTNAIIGKNSINDLFSVEPVLGRAYYFFFVLFLLWILMTMLNATLNVGITSVRQNKVQQSYSIMDLLSNFWKDAVGLILTSRVDDKPSEKKKDPLADFILNKNTPKELEIIRPTEHKTVFVRPRVIYQ